VSDLHDSKPNGAPGSSWARRKFQRRLSELFGEMANLWNELRDLEERRTRILGRLQRLHAEQQTMFRGLKIQDTQDVAWQELIEEYGSSADAANSPEYPAIFLDPDAEPPTVWETLLLYLTKDPDRVWQLKELHEHLEERGWNIKNSTLRVTVHRAVEDGDLERVERGKYRVADRLH